MITRPFATALLLAGALLLAPAAPAAAQGARTPEARLATRLDATTREQVLVEVAAARQEGLPVDKLVERALEGASKRARPDRIVNEVRQLRFALGEARLALGRDASPVELEAGASAIQARVGTRVMARLRRARPDGSLTVPLAVLTDLVAYGVPVDTAARTVLALARAQDAALVAYQRDVERDISVGAVPAAAASLRANVLERTLFSGDNLETTRGPTNANAPGLNNGGGRSNQPPVRRKP